MRMVFVRLDEKTFMLVTGKSEGCGDERMIERLEMELTDYFLRRKQPSEEENRKFYSQSHESERRFAKKVIRFAKKEGYVFWDIFDFWRETFSYDAKKEVFFENKRQGKTLKETLEAMTSGT